MKKNLKSDFNILFFFNARVQRRSIFWSMNVNYKNEHKILIHTF